MDPAKFDGIIFTDKEKGIDWSFPDYRCDRIPRKGDVMHFRHFHENDCEMYYGEVLFVIDTRQMWGEKKMQDSPIKKQVLQL